MSMETADPRSDIEAAWAAHKLTRVKIAKEEGCFFSTMPQSVRMRLFESQNWRCCYCGTRMFVRGIDPEKTFAMQEGLPRQGKGRHKALLDRSATIEHYIRRADGGTDDVGNLAGCCHWCNVRRVAREPDVWLAQIQWLKATGQHPHFPQPQVESVAVLG